MSKSTPLSSRQRIILTHLSLWGFFFLAPVMFEPFISKYSPAEILNQMPVQLQRTVGALLNVPLIAFFYLNYSLVMPGYYMKGQVRRYLLAIVLLYIGFEALSFSTHYFIIYQVLHVEYKEGAYPFIIVFSTLFFVFMWAASSGLRLSEEWRKTEDQRRETENRQLMAELALLKSQINPHFLLNSLNNLYALALTDPEKTPSGLLKLSEMVGYILYECNKPSVALKDDLSFIKNYIALQKLRLPPNATLDLEMPENPPEVYIEPMILISFIENAFKHGLTTQRPCTILIHIKTTPSQLSLLVENLLLPAKQEKGNHPSGIGLKNTMQRLEHSYPNKHEIRIETTADKHRVHLHIHFD